MADNRDDKRTTPKQGDGNNHLLNVYKLLILLIFIIIFFLPAQHLTIYAREASGMPDILLAVAIPIIWILALTLVFRIIGKYAYHVYLRRHRPYLPNRFQEAMEALDRIAEGDFNVLLEVDDKFPGYYNELAGKINELAKGLGATEKMRQEFVSSVSHEIQSPLTSIRGFASLLKDESLDPETRRHYLEIIETESVRLSKLSENLLRLSVLDNDGHTLNKKPYWLDQQVKSAILLLEPQWSEKNLELEVDLEPVELVGDQDLLSQVWINLINNSIKFTPEGGKLSMSLHLDGELCEFSLSDTGIGMSPEVIERIFERFYKADAARMRAKGGNGLGLSIVRQIIALHSGRINVESEEGKGSTFTVRLPMK